MGIKVDDLREFVVIPVLEKLEINSQVRANLILGTAAQESHMGTYLKQIKGPALGIYQCEPATHIDIWENYLRYRDELASKVSSLLPPTRTWEDKNKQLITNLSYATAICAIHYLRAAAELPYFNNAERLSKYWKTYYNTHKGSGTESQFILNYQKYVGYQ